MTPEQHLDLSALAVDLRSRGEHKPLVSAIERAAAIGSIRDLMDVSDEILARNWPKVVGLGRRLLERRTMDEDELFEWFQANPPHHHVDDLPL